MSHVPRLRPLRACAAALVCLAWSACRVEVGTPAGGASAASERPAVLVYTSMYRPVVEAMTAALKEDLPGVEVRWYQAGSEKVAARLDAERAAGACPADILATSDPAHFLRLKAEGALAPMLPVGALQVPRALLDEEGAWVTMRLATMVLAWREGTAAPPERTADLWGDAFRGSATVGDPLTSGTFFTSLGILELAHGRDLFSRMRAAQVVAAGSNAAVLEKLLAGEKRAGMLLLENVLMARAAGQPVAWRVPADGVVMVPGPVAMLRTAPRPAAAREVMEWFFTPRAQRIIVETGMMHAARTDVAPPPGVPALEELMARATGMSGATWEKLRDEGPAMKARFSEAYGR